MKASIRLAMAAAAAASLAACATTDDRYVASQQQGVHVTDTEYVTAVEQVATTRGVRVVWVNPPEVRTDGGK